MSESQLPRWLTVVPAVFDGVVDIIRHVIALTAIAFISRWSNNSFIDGLWLVCYAAIFGKYCYRALMFVLPRIRPNQTLMFASIAGVCATTAIALSLASNILVTPLTKAVVQVALLMR